MTNELNKLFIAKDLRIDIKNLLDAIMEKSLVINDYSNVMSDDIGLIYGNARELNKLLELPKECPEYD